MSYRILNLEKELGSRHKGEDILAFASLDIHVGGTASPDLPPPPPRNGVLTISGGGVQGTVERLRSSFMVDVEENLDLCARLQDIFQRLGQAATNTLLGQDFEYRVPLKTRSLEGNVWFVQEVIFSFKAKAGKDVPPMRKFARGFVEGRVLPFLSRALPVSFGELQWWDEETSEPSVEEKTKAISRTMEFRVRDGVPDVQDF